MVVHLSFVILPLLQKLAFKLIVENSYELLDNRLRNHKFDRVNLSFDLQVIVNNLIPSMPEVVPPLMPIYQMIPLFLIHCVNILFKNLQILRTIFGEYRLLENVVCILVLAIFGCQLYVLSNVVVVMLVNHRPMV